MYYHKLIYPPQIIFTPFDGEGNTQSIIELNSEETLRNELAVAVEKEDYEKAIIYRNELRRRNLL